MAVQPPDNELFRIVTGIASWVWIWTPDDADVDRLAEQWDAARDLDTQQADLVEQQAAGVPAAWPDTNGGKYVALLRQQAGVYRQQAAQEQQIGDLVRRYAESIRQYNNAMRAEFIHQGIIFAGLMLLNPLAAAARGVMIIGSILAKAASLMRFYASTMRFPGLAPGASRVAKMADFAKKQALDAGGESLQEINTTAIEKGGYTAPDAALSGTAGALGSLTSTPVGKYLTGPVTAPLGRRTGETLQAGTTNALTSPGAGLGAQAIVEGDPAKLADGDAWSEAYSAQNMMQAGVVGGTAPHVVGGGEKLSLHLARQLDPNFLRPDGTPPVVDNPGGDGNPPGDGTTASPPGDATTPPATGGNDAVPPGSPGSSDPSESSSTPEASGTPSTSNGSEVGGVRPPVAGPLDTGGDAPVRPGSAPGQSNNAESQPSEYQDDPDATNDQQSAVEEQQAEQQPAEQQSAEQQSAEQQSAEQQSAEQQQPADQPTDEQPVEQQPIEQQSAEEELSSLVGEPGGSDANSQDTTLAGGSVAPVATSVGPAMAPNVGPSAATVGPPSAAGLASATTARDERQDEAEQDNAEQDEAEQDNEVDAVPVDEGAVDESPVADQPVDESVTIDQAAADSGVAALAAPAAASAAVVDGPAAESRPEQPATRPEHTDVSAPTDPSPARRPRFFARVLRPMIGKAAVVTALTLGASESTPAVDPTPAGPTPVAADTSDTQGTDPPIVVHESGQRGRPDRHGRRGPGPGTPDPDRGRRTGSRRTEPSSFEVAQVRRLGLVPNGRPRGDALTEAEALNALTRLTPADLEHKIAGQPIIVTGPDGDRLAVVDTPAHGEQAFRVEIRRQSPRKLAKVDFRTGSRDDPHIVQLAPGLADSKLAEVWSKLLHQTLRHVEHTTPARTVPPLDRRRVRAQHLAVELNEWADDLEQRAKAEYDTAKAAIEEAKRHLTEAVTERGRKDSGARERARKAELNARNSGDLARRHFELSDAYGKAAERAAVARDAQRALLDEINEVSSDPSRSEVELTTRTDLATDRFQEFSAGLARTRPPNEVLPSGVPDIQVELPHLTELTNRVNQLLADHGVPEHQRFTRGKLRWQLGAAFRDVVSEDGVVLTVTGDPLDAASSLVQIRIRLTPGELSEVVGTKTRLAEGIVGQFDQSGHGVADLATRSRNDTAGFDFRPYGEMLATAQPMWGGLVQALGPGIEGSTGRSRKTKGAAFATDQSGAVEDNRGESLLYEAPASWDVRVRTSALDSWSATETVDRGGRKDADTLRVWLSHAYTVSPPVVTTTISELGGTPSGPLPKAVAAHVGGLNELADDAMREADELVGGLDRMGHDKIRQLITEELPSLLDEATKPNGIQRTISVGDRDVAYVDVRTRVVLESVELVGTPSTEHWQEEERIGFSGASGDQTFGGSGSKKGKLGPAFEDLGTSDLDLEPKASLGRGTSGSDAMSVEKTAIDVSVQRYKGPTQGYRLRLEHEVTIRTRKGGKSVHGHGEALLRIPEHRAFRYGLPVDAAALRRTSDGEDVLRTSDGQPLLRGDPRPTGELDLPAWLGDPSEGKLRGAGPALVQNVTGADAALGAMLPELSERGLIPPLDNEHRPRMDQMSGIDPQRVANQLSNLERIWTAFSKLGAETDYNMAAQDGIPVALVEHRAGHSPRIHTFRIQLRQDFGNTEALGLTDSWDVVRLPIGSDSSARSGGRSGKLPWLAKLPLGNKPAEGQDGSKFSVGFGRSGALLGRAMNWAFGSRVNQVTLVESTAPLAEFVVPHTLTVVEDGSADPLVEVEGGSAHLLIDSELCKPALAAAPQLGEVSQGLLEHATILHLDVGDPMAKLVTEFDGELEPDSAAYHHLAELINSRSLTAHPEWTHTAIGTQLGVRSSPSWTQVIQQASLSPDEVSASVRGRVSNQRLVGVTPQVTGDINLTLYNAAVTQGRFSERAGSLSGGYGTQESDGDAFDGSGEGGRSSGTARSRTTATVGGWERLRIGTGLQYVFQADVSMTAKVRAGELNVAKQVALDNGTVVYTVAEQEALRRYGRGQLELPVAQVADAVERFLDGTVDLDRKTATEVLGRYVVEKVGSTDELAESHTDDRLIEKLRDVARLPASGPKQTLGQVLAAAEALAANPTEVGLPEHYDHTMGAAMIESVVDADNRDQPVDVHAHVHEAIGNAASAALADPVLAESLYGDFAGKRWRGHIDNMFDPGGFVKSYPVKAAGTTDPPTELVVRIRARWDGPATTDSRPDRLAVEQALGILQGYEYDERGRSRAHGWGYSATPAGGSVDVTETSGNVGTGRSRELSASSAEQLTRLQRLAHFETTRLERGLRLEIEVEARPRAGEPTVPVRQPTIRTRMTQLVPLALVQRTGQRPGQLEETRGPVELPNAYVVEGSVPDRSGEPATDELVDRVSERLAGKGFLGAAEARSQRVELENLLSAARRNATFQQMASEEGHVVELPGKGQSRIDMRLRAKVSDAALVSGPVDNGEIGHVDRVQHTTQTGITGSHLPPATAGASHSGAVPGLSGQRSVGEQSMTHNYYRAGNRKETSGFGRGQIVTVRVRYDCDVEFDRVTVDRHGNEKTRRSDPMPAGGGQAYLTMFYEDYLEMRKAAEGSGNASGTSQPPASQARGKPPRHTRVGPGQAGGRPGIGGLGSTASNGNPDGEVGPIAEEDPIRRCVELRPDGVDQLDRSGHEPVDGEGERKIRASHAALVEALEEATDEEGLFTEEDVEVMLPEINPTRGQSNCVECAMAVDDFFDGRAAVAGPSGGQQGGFVTAPLADRGQKFEEISPEEIHQLLGEPNARGIVIGWAGHYAVHAYNVVNIQGTVLWLDGQTGRWSEFNSSNFNSFDFYRTDRPDDG